MPDSLKPKRYMVIGAGFSGAVLARTLADALDCRIEVWDERAHIGGNCHTERDSETGITLHKYGPHIFNTDNERVWAYVNQFGELRPFINRVKACTSRGMFTMPINLLTINQLFAKTLNPAEAKVFVENLGESTIGEPRNFEEQALKMLGRKIYETFFEGYTRKQWGCDPTDLPASVLKRLPVRFNYDDNYYNKKFQGIPVDGYTAIIEKILDHPRIEVHLGKKFDLLLFGDGTDRPDHLFYTGPIDAYFGYQSGRLGYRTVYFEQIATDAEDYQGNAVINYPDLDVPWTRIHEHKHFTPWEHHKKTVAFREFSKETEPQDIPYYPKRLAKDCETLKAYRKLAEDFDQQNLRGFRTSFLGRLATYRYMDMEAVIAEALLYGERFVEHASRNAPLSPFPNSEQ